ncbi:Methyltransferase small domain-containing protein [Jatrophihabitans endophyticus]|uniref:Methyltransferase small domain-containing protein n=1 Tax=Jatrophihabitans endophyticus TaxID=1206085 RepID=A0A1M5M468_9ACTN|nr:class I SAM-dependent methyltransferase [Jatrophihabitans endophyticus]SHG72097.1 Methyltransferase small domain-containing protein [Jatrophihabitans endophyticus]
MDRRAEPSHRARPPAPLLAPADLDRLRTALAGYTVETVPELLGPIGRGAHSRGDLAGVARAVTAVAADEPRLATLVRLFLLGLPVPSAQARAALAPLPVELAEVAGLVTTSGGETRALLDVRPYAESEGGGAAWWVVSDLGSDVRPGPLPGDHVLGVGNAAVTLAQATPRAPVGTALDIGTGCGVQALHLGRHAGTVTATDISARALRFAATTAALSGQRWRLEQGSLLEPVAGARYDLVVANPPFVVSPGATEHEYRDSGLAGDAVCRTLVRGIPAVLAPAGTAQLLANWIVPRDGSWQDRLAGWFDGTGCDAWVWRRETADPGEYVALWLRDAGHRPGAPEWAARYDAWLDWFAAHDVAAVGMGLVTMRARAADQRSDATDVVIEDVPQAVDQPVAAEIEAWFARRRVLADCPDADLLARQWRAAPDLVRTRDDLLAPDGGWATRRAVLRQPTGMRWEVEVDDAVARIVAACDAGATPAVALDLLAAGTAGTAGPADDPAAWAAAFAPVLRDLVTRGFLLPTTPAEPPRTRPAPRAAVPPRPAPPVGPPPTDGDDPA